MIDLTVSGELSITAASDQRLRDYALALCPEEPLPGVSESHWPNAFLMSQQRSRDSDLWWVGSWVIALTLAIQRWGGDPAWRGRVVCAEANRLSLAMPWTRDVFFREALELSVEILCRGLATGPPREPLRLREYFGDRWPSILTRAMAPDTVRFIEAAAARAVPFSLLPNFIQLGWGANAERIDKSFTGRTSWMADTLARDYWKCKRALASAEVPVPHAWVATTIDEAEGIASRWGWPMVVKPLYRLGHGRGGVAAGISDVDGLHHAFERAAECSAGGVIVEEHIDGDDHRLLVVNGRFLAAALCGGDAVQDVTAQVHPDNRALAERVARIVGLDIAGVDFLTADISASWQDVGGAVYGVSGQPDLRPHRAADPRRDISGEVLDCLFAGRSARIPTAAITGTNGKTTTAQMLFTIWMATGKLTGVCTTVAVRIGSQLVSTKNLSGAPGARVILTDPGVEAAVFEMPRKGLIYFGHPCDRYDVAALLNVQPDHLGVDGVDTLEQMAELKAEVLERACRAVVVNADDPLCMAMRSRAGTDRHILITRNPADRAIVEHRRDGGEVLFVADRDGTQCIVLAVGDREETVIRVGDVPATMNGLLRFNVVNAMFATGLAWAQGIDIATIRLGISGFHSSAEQNPGRYNFIDGFPFQVLLDFAHNPDGVREVCAVAAQLPVTGRRILCSRGIGSNSAAQFRDVATSMTESFDEFVIGCVPRYVAECPDYVGSDPVATMLAGARECLLEAGASAGTVITVPDPAESIRTALSLAQPGDLLVLLAEPGSALPVVEDYRRTL